MKIRYIKTITPLLVRVIVFVAIFVVVSGLIGPRIIGGDIMFRDGFALYGGIGKALIFGLIAFMLLARHNKTQVLLKPWRISLAWWSLSSLMFFALAWVSVDNLIANERTLQNLTYAHGGLLLGLGFAAMGCFGPKNIQLLWHTYKRQIIGSFGLAALFYIFLLVVYALWPPLASVVLFGVNGLLELSGLQTAILPPHTLILDKFGITIAEYCSGIESIALFTGLYAIVGLLDWKRLNLRRYFIVFPIALIVLFALNIVRVFALILAGYYINQEIAFSLFHTYAGMLFFIFYSAIFWAIAYKHLLKQAPQKKHENPTSN